MSDFTLRPCMGCGKPIPQLEFVDDKCKFCCTKCGCETKPQDDLMKARELWNDGAIYPKNEAEFMRRVTGRLK